MLSIYEKNYPIRTHILNITIKPFEKKGENIWELLKKLEQIKVKENARKFYNMFMNSNCQNAAIVVERSSSSNPNIDRCRFIAVPSTIAFGENPVVIAESVLGIAGCFNEFLKDIKERKK